MDVQPPEKQMTEIKLTIYLLLSWVLVLSYLNGAFPLLSGIELPLSNS
jgi:hypothetical protein